MGKLALFPGGGEPGTFYHVHDIKGRHDLIIMRRWTKLGAHARSSTSLLRLLQSSFQVNMVFSMLLLSLQPALYSCLRRISRFLDAVATTRPTTTMLAYNTTNHNFLPFSPSDAVSDALRSYYTGLPCDLQLV